MILTPENSPEEFKKIGWPPEDNEKPLIKQLEFEMYEVQFGMNWWNHDVISSVTNPNSTPPLKTGDLLKMLKEFEHQKENHIDHLLTLSDGSQMMVKWVAMKFYEIGADNLYMDVKPLSLESGFTVEAKYAPTAYRKILSLFESEETTRFRERCKFLASMVLCDIRSKGRETLEGLERIGFRFLEEDGELSKWCGKSPVQFSMN